MSVLCNKENVRQQNGQGKSLWKGDIWAKNWEGQGFSHVDVQGKSFPCKEKCYKVGEYKYIQEASEKPRWLKLNEEEGEQQGMVSENQ